MLNRLREEIGNVGFLFWKKIKKCCRCSRAMIRT
jgi:hypothetical protein